MNEKEKALRNVTYSLYLQIFIGIGWIAPTFFGMKLPNFMSNSTAIAGALILLALNSLLYLGKCK